MHTVYILHTRVGVGASSVKGEREKEGLEKNINGTTSLFTITIRMECLWMIYGHLVICVVALSLLNTQV